MPGFLRRRAVGFGTLGPGNFGLGGPGTFELGGPGRGTFGLGAFRLNGLLGSGRRIAFHRRHTGQLLVILVAAGKENAKQDANDDRHQNSQQQGS